MADSLMTQFENALCDLVERYMRDGLKPEEVTTVLRTRAEDDYRGFLMEKSEC